MKAILLILLCAGCSSSLPKADIQPAARVASSKASAAIINPPPTITVSWSYPLGLETPDLVFNLYHSYSLTVSPAHWPLLKVIPGSERSTRVERTQPMEFFVLTASNRLGESGFATQ